MSSSPPLFAPTRDADVTRLIVEAFARDFSAATRSDCLIVGGGPSGLVAGMDLARQGFKVLVIEQANYLGGGFWMGGFMFNKVTVRTPADAMLRELGIPYEEPLPGVCLLDAPHACAKLIAAACDAGVKFANMVKAVDLVYRHGRVEGVMVNWAAVYAMPKGLAHVDPVALEAPAVLDATGHDAALVTRARKIRGEEPLPGNGAMWIEASEEAVVARTREVCPGLFVAGLAVAAVDGSPRMGPTFGAMLLSGREAGRQIAARLAAGGGGGSGSSGSDALGAA